MRRLSFALLLLMLLAPAWPQAVHASGVPVITTAKVDLERGTLTLQGKNLGRSPTVAMGTSGGAFNQLLVVASDPQHVEALLPGRHRARHVSGRSATTISVRVYQCHHRYAGRAGRARAARRYWAGRP